MPVVPAVLLVVRVVPAVLLVVPAVLLVVPVVPAVLLVVPVVLVLRVVADDGDDDSRAFPVRGSSASDSNAGSAEGCVCSYLRDASVLFGGMLFHMWGVFAWVGCAVVGCVFVFFMEESASMDGI